MQVVELCDNSTYDVPNDLVAVLRAIRGEIRLQDEFARPIVGTIQEEIDKLRGLLVPVSQVEVKRIEARRNPEYWVKQGIYEPLYNLILDLCSDGRPYFTLEQVLDKAENHPKLRNYTRSIRQRIGDLINRYGKVAHYYKDEKIVPGYYVLPQKPTIIQNARRASAVDSKGDAP